MLKRILMNQADASPGNSAPAAAAVPAEQPQAQAAPTVNPIEKTIADLASVVDGLAKSVNSLHAERRRASESPTRSAAKTETQTNNPPADDPSSLLALRDAFDDATSELKLSKGQRQLLRDAVMTKRPSDVDGFVSDYASRAGWTAQAAASPAAIAATTPVAAAQPAAATQPRPAPSSDRGSPPVVTVALDQQNVLSLSPSDREALRKQIGDAKYAAKVLEDSKGQTFRLR